jgi:hypothetical protein
MSPDFLTVAVKATSPNASTEFNYEQNYLEQNQQGLKPPNHPPKIKYLQWDKSSEAYYCTQASLCKGYEAAPSGPTAPHYPPPEQADDEDEEKKDQGKNNPSEQETKEKRSPPKDALKPVKIERGRKGSTPSGSNRHRSRSNKGFKQHPKKAKPQSSVSPPSGRPSRSPSPNPSRLARPVRTRRSPSRSQSSKRRSQSRNDRSRSPAPAGAAPPTTSSPTTYNNRQSHKEAKEKDNKNPKFKNPKFTPQSYKPRSGADESTQPTKDSVPHTRPSEQPRLPPPTPSVGDNGDCMIPFEVSNQDY